MKLVSEVAQGANESYAPGGTGYDALVDLDDRRSMRRSPERPETLDPGNIPNLQDKDEL